MNGYDFGAPMTQKQRFAYNDGLRNGQTDRRLGIRSTYASIAFSTEPEYVQYYSRGYNKGVLSLAN